MRAPLTAAAFLAFSAYAFSIGQEHYAGGAFFIATIATFLSLEW
jgi:hypothetical protein